MRKRRRGQLFNVARALFSLLETAYLLANFFSLPKRSPDDGWHKQRPLCLARSVSESQEVARVTRGGHHEEQEARKFSRGSDQRKRARDFNRTLAQEVEKKTDSRLARDRNKERDLRHLVKEKRAEQGVNSSGSTISSAGRQTIL